LINIQKGDWKSFIEATAGSLSGIPISKSFEGEFENREILS
jgi:hypothetical protein